MSTFLTHEKNARYLRPAHAAEDSLVSGSSGGAKPSSLALPDENTDAGAMTRLFIAEVAVPEGSDMKEARRARWIGCAVFS